MLNALRLMIALLSCAGWMTAGVNGREKPPARADRCGRCTRSATRPCPKFLGTPTSWPVRDTTAQRPNIAMMFWLLEGPDRLRVLVDAGFYRQKFLDGLEARRLRAAVRRSAALTAFPPTRSPT
jgi:hypothetical protein